MTDTVARAASALPNARDEGEDMPALATAANAAIKHSKMFSNAKERNKSEKPTNYYTPPFALSYIDPIIDKLKQKMGWTKCWECAAGPPNGPRAIADHMKSKGWDVIATDIEDGAEFDMYQYQPPSDQWDLLITNPPFSNKSLTIQRAYDLILMNEGCKGWILLLPTVSLDSSLIRNCLKRYNSSTHCWSIVVPPKVIDYVLEDPTKKSRSFFHSSYFMYLPRDIEIEGMVLL